MSKQSIPMSREDRLLVILAEEAAEVAQEASKCLRFGPDEIYPPIGMSNAMRVMVEYHDLMALVEMLQQEGVLPIIGVGQEREWVEAKRKAVEKHLTYSRECGR